MITMGIAKYWAEWCIKQRELRTFCLVVGALGCLEILYGTLLAVLTFIVLGRESEVKQFNPNVGQ